MKKNRDDKSFSSTMKGLLRYVEKYKFHLFFAVFFSCAFSVFSLYIPILCGKAIDCIVTKGQVDFSTLYKIFIQIGLVLILSGISQWLMNTLSNVLSYGVSKNMRTDIFEKLNSLPLSFVDSHSHGDIISRLISDVDQISDGLLLGFTDAFSGIVTIIGTICFMISINWKIALIVIFLTPLSLFVARFIAKKSYSSFKKTSEARGTVTAFVNEMVDNQKIVKSFSMEKSCIDKFDVINKNLRDNQLKATFFSSITNPTTGFTNSIIYAICCLTGSFAIIGGAFKTGSVAFTVGSLTAILGYANHYGKPFNEISSIITELQNAFACASRVFEILGVDSVENPNEMPKINTEDISGTITFDNVSFSYTKDRPLIENFSAKVKKGQKVAIVGPTGCGKTTMINLLMRFYDVNSGAIYLDDKNINDIDRQSLRSCFGMVLQDTWIKTGTVRENIALSRPDATEEEVIDAAKKAHAYSFICRLSDGFDTMISGDGSSLSVGERQLLCIARVMLTKPKILILDEATSSIDVRTEMKIQKGFAELMGTGDEKRTSFVVAHRLSTIQNADLILVMRDGKIIESGYHEELMDKKGFYYELYESQFV